jgi:hypothetical protein
MRTATCWTLVSLVVLSFAPGSNSQVPFGEESPAKAEVREAVFRYFLDQYDHPTRVTVFCIAAELPLSDSFIRRFSKIRPPVVRASDCDRSASENIARNKKTGEVGLYITISSFRWIKGEEAEANIDVGSDGALWNANTLRILFDHGHWKVVSDKVDFEF